jgi:hypothetical protein
MDDELAPIDFICVDPSHIRMGRDVPDGEGHLTLYERRWAYCSAGLPKVTHAWRATGGIAFPSIRHDALPNLPTS